MTRKHAHWYRDVQAAIKFYLDRKGFERERELYTESELQAMMPATLAVEDNASGDCKTPYGYVFPPFVIIERGESLDEWSRDNVNTDFITIFQVRHTMSPIILQQCVFLLRYRRVNASVPRLCRCAGALYAWATPDSGCQQCG